MNFKKDRFTNFARYDLAVNKSFYRNMALVTVVGAIGITVLGFMGRYLLWENTSGTWGTSDPWAEANGYNTMRGTGGFITGFLALMMCIFSGCWAHNLRNKQGRITELTLPATNLEKFLWHTGLTVLGGLTLCVLSLLVADGVNALLTLMTYGAENGVGSLTATVGKNINLSMWDDIIAVDEPGTEAYADGYVDEVTTKISVLMGAMRYLFITGMIADLFIYMFGNALKYKYNIILTYIAMQVISVLVTFIVFLCIGIFGYRINAETLFADQSDIITNMTIFLYVLGSLIIIISALLAWRSYHLYTKAQITSSLNK